LLSERYFILTLPHFSPNPLTANIFPLNGPSVGLPSVSSPLHTDPGPPCEIGKAQISSLRSLGHKLERFLAARELVHRKILQDEAFASVRPWLGQSPAAPTALEGEGTFVSVFLRQEMGVRLGAVVLPTDVATQALALWRQTDPEAPKVLPPLLPSPPDAAAPLWMALLRLRPLRGVWESVLRRDHFETLLQISPDAWLLDPAPLPPGSVIPRLELPGWDRLSHLQREGRQFAISSPGTLDGANELSEAASAGSWTTAVQAALETTAAEPRILVELPRTPESWLLAFYEKKGTRVDARGFLSLSKTPDGAWQAARVR
jgi:hypothetical protein